MQFRKNAHVVTSTGKRVGRIHRVVIDPGSREVTHLVVAKGIVFKEDKVLPVEQVESTAEDTVTLQKGAVDPDRTERILKGPRCGPVVGSELPQGSLRSLPFGPTRM